MEGATAYAAETALGGRLGSRTLGFGPRNGGANPSPPAFNARDPLGRTRHMFVDAPNLQWLAGLLEGEGSFVAGPAERAALSGRPDRDGGP